MTPWEEVILRRNANIGFVSRVGGLKPPTAAEIATALSIEEAAWNLSRGKVTWSTSKIGYTTPQGHGINLKRTREPGEKLDGPEYEKAVHSYMVTPMDHYDVLKAQGIDVSKWEVKRSIINKLFYRVFDWWSSFDPEYEEPNRMRLTQEFLDMFPIKEKK